MIVAGVARAAAAATDERVVIAVIGSMAIVAGIALVRLFRG
jgi:hypothetical protein